VGAASLAVLAAVSFARRCQFIRRQLAVAVAVHASEAILRRGEEFVFVA
jgi:hypothetical protein